MPILNTFNSLSVYKPQPSVPFKYLPVVTPVNTWTAPSDALFVNVLLVGPGGRGGPYNGTYTQKIYGGGGGGGQIIEYYKMPVVPNQTYTLYKGSDSTKAFGLTALKGLDGSMGNLNLGGGLSSGGKGGNTSVVVTNLIGSSTTTIYSGANGRGFPTSVQLYYGGGGAGGGGSAVDVDGGPSYVSKFTGVSYSKGGSGYADVFSQAGQGGSGYQQSVWTDGTLGQVEIQCAVKL